MGLLGRKITAGMTACAVLLGGSPVLSVQAQERYSLSHEEPEYGEAYVLWPAKEESKYEVAAGDSLWKIADELWGDGRLYPELYELNRQTVKDPDLICPGQILRTARPWYLEKWGGSIEYTDIFRYAQPDGCTVGLLSRDGIGASCVLYGQGDKNYDIACMIRERENTQNELADDESWERNVADYAARQYGDSVRDLSFEHYLSENGELICLYSYVYEIDLSRYDQEGCVDIYVSAGVRQTEHMQADFVGFGMEGDSLRDRVRYLTVSFEELLPEGAECTVNDNNIIIYPSTKWDAVSFNALAWIDQYFDAGLRVSTGYQEKQKSNKEKLLDRMREGKGVYGGEKKAGN